MKKVYRSKEKGGGKSNRVNFEGESQSSTTTTELPPLREKGNP